MRQRVYAEVPLKASLINLACFWMFDTDENVGKAFNLYFKQH